ncbi:ATP-binding protein [Parapedobacter defluvii]|nr:ATP-binding protein [Parapedobacter defluvii]
MSSTGVSQSMGNKGTGNESANRNEGTDGLPVSLESCLLDLRQAEETIRQQQRLLYQSEAQHNLLFDSLDEGFCTVEVLFDNADQSIDYRFLKVNGVFEAQTGIENPLGRTMREIAPEHEQYWFEMLGRIALTGKSQRLEHWANALGRFYDIYAFRVGDPMDRQVAILFKDITERKRQEELQAYLLRLNDALRSLSDPIQVQDVVTHLAMKHLGADRCYYCEIEEGNAIIRRDAFRADLPSVANVYPLSDFPILSTVINAGHPFVVFDAHTTELLDDGLRQLCLQTQAISFVDIPIIKDDSPCGILCITCCEPRKWRKEEIELARETAERTWIAVEQARAAEALRESEENYRAIVNQSIAGILKIGLEGNMLFTNDQFCRMLGYEGAELLAMHVNRIVYPEDHERNAAAFHGLVSEGRAYEIEKRFVRKEGAIIWVNNHVSPIFNNKGEVDAAAIVSIDITRQKELERQKDEFIGIASHELKTPITSIKAYGQILAAMIDQSSVPPTFTQLLTKMNAQIDRLIKLIYSLLNTSRIAGNQLTLQLEPIDLNGLLEEHVRQGQLTTSRHRITFIGEKLPSVMADVERMGQVMDNLISNAIKYAPKGGDVIVRAESRGGWVRVSIRDFGVGIPKEAQEKIFDRFYRVNDASAGGTSGIGLGLYICREIISRHQGQMAVESIPDEGSTFYFELPVYTERQ